MPAHRADDPLTPLSVRLPRSVVEALRTEAAAERVTVSDAVRAKVSIENVKPLGERPPRKRLPALPQSIIQADPALARQLAAIGSNLNQLARSVHLNAITGTRIEAIELMLRLRSIERDISTFALAKTDR